MRRLILILLLGSWIGFAIGQQQSQAEELIFVSRPETYPVWCNGTNAEMMEELTSGIRYPICTSVQVYVKK